jgi:hypothetical protein
MQTLSGPASNASLPKLSTLFYTGGKFNLQAYTEPSHPPLEGCQFSYELSSATSLATDFSMYLLPHCLFNLLPLFLDQI